jgi:hypothetical protein
VILKRKDGNSVLERVTGESRQGKSSENASGNNQNGKEISEEWTS